MKKRIVSGILVISMLFSIFPTSAVFAEKSDTEISDYGKSEPIISDLDEDSVDKDNIEDISYDSDDVSLPKGDYSEWKKQKVLDLDNNNSNISLFDVGISSNQITNDYLDLLVQNGTYSYRTTGGNPDSLTDDNALLLYDGTSHTTIKIDDNVYRFASNNIEVDEEGTKIASSVEYDGIKIDQIFSFVFNPYTKRNDMVEFKYVFTNKDSVKKSVGSRIFFDIMLADNDTAPFKIPGYGDVVTETEFLKDELFQVWQTFDDLHNPTIVASGKLYDSADEKPDKIQFLNWDKGEETIWDCYVDENADIEDSAINIYFNPTEINPGESKTIKTYYGLASLQTGNNINMGLSAFAPTELEKNKDNRTYISNPFTINGFVENKTDSKLTNVKAVLNLPEELSTDNEFVIPLGDIESGENKPFAWEISAFPQYKESYIEYSVTLQADEVDDETTPFYIHLPRLLDDYGNVITEPIGELKENDYTNGTFEIYEDTDVFSYTPTEDGVYSFESVSGVSAIADLKSDGNVLRQDISSGTGDKFYIVEELKKGKKYYLTISPNGLNSVGDYSLCVNKLSDDAGNTHKTAMEILEKEEFDGLINYPCDIDVFYFTATRSGYYSASTTGELDAYIELTDSLETVLAVSTDNGQGKANVSYKLTEGQTYYVKVMHKNHTDKDDAGIGAYSLFVAYDETPPVINSLLSETKDKYNKSFELEVAASDNVAVDTVALLYSYDKFEWQTLDIIKWNNTWNSKTYTIDTTTFNDGTVYIRAEAVDISGNKSVQSPTNAYIVDNTAPDAVDIVSAISIVGANYISWKKSDESDAQGYNIYRSSDNGNTYSIIKNIDNINSLFYIDTNTITGTKYFYKITAYDDLDQESSPTTVSVIAINDMSSDEAIKNIAIQPEKTTFFVGETSKLNADIEYINGEVKNVNDLLTYDISDKSIISVDKDGTVRGLKGGNATLSVTIGNNSIEIPYVIRSITVSVSSNVMVSDSKEQITVQNHTLEGIIDVANKATYTVDNPSIISVNNSGEILALASGKANITIEYNGQKETISVTVYARPGKVDSINIENNAVDISVSKVLTWKTTEETEKYNVYVWKKGEDKPNSPTARNIINTMFQMRLEYNSTYCVQIESINKYASNHSSVFEFSTIGLPDLECVSVTAPSDVFSESNILVSWEIKNTGTKSTDSKEWYDYIYLSPDADFDYNTAVFLGRKSNYTYLEAGESYKNDSTFTVPRGITGKYYVYVVTDYNYNIYELNDANNIGKSSGINIKLCPQPDLKIEKINTSFSDIISGNEITVTYESRNIGNEIPDEPFIGGWVDEIYLSADETLSDQDIKLAAIPITVFSGTQNTDSQTHIFYKDKKYQVSKTVAIPQNIFGDYYIIVAVDNSDFVYENDNNNNYASKKISVTLDPPADVVPLIVDMPSEMVSAGNYTLRWKDINEGSRDISGELWSDRIYIDKNKQINMNTAQLLKTVNGVREDNINSVEISLPVNIEGEYYIHIVSDYAHKIFEYNTYDNNTVSTGVNITMRELPDLTVKNISLQNELRANEKAEISYIVENIGVGSTVENSWQDTIYISANEQFDNTATVLATFRHNGNLSSTDNYTASISVNIPSDITGENYLFVKTNSTDRVQESGDNANNISASYNVDILDRYESDLRVTDARTNGLKSDSEAVLSIKWTVTNFGPNATPNPRRSVT